MVLDGLTQVLCLRASGDADMIQILLGVLAHHLAFMAANWTFDNNFWTGSRRSIHIGWSHKIQATRLGDKLQGESTQPRLFMAFQLKGTTIQIIDANFLGLATVQWYTKTSR